MARGQTLSTLRTLLKAELREVQDTNTALDTELNYALSMKQRDLANQMDWDFLRHMWDVSITPGTRFYNIPTTDKNGLAATINFARPVQVDRKWYRVYEPVSYGITDREYSIREGDTETQDPILRWQVVSNVNESTNPDQIEVWPSPASAQTLRITGQRAVKTLSSESDTADLDDLLLVYMVAADYLLFRGQQNAGLVQAKAVQHMERLRNNYPGPVCPPVKFGGYPNYGRERVRLVAVK